MPGGRPRADGRPSIAPLVGVDRITPSGVRWKLTGYYPTTDGGLGRLHQINVRTERMTTENVPAGQTLARYFRAREKYWNDVDAGMEENPYRFGSSSAENTVRDLDALGSLYLARLTTSGLEATSVANRRSNLKKWISPRIGHVLVTDWTVEDSVRVLSDAAAEVGPDQVAAIRLTLSQMRDTAWALIDGERWLSKVRDPLAEVGFHLKASVQGADVKYIEPHVRPSMTSVMSAIDAAAQIGRWSWQPLCYRVAAFCGPRLAEQLALRVIDIDLRRRSIDVNGRWKVSAAQVKGGPRRRRRVRSAKNGKRRFTPYPASLHDALVARILHVLDLGPQAGEAEAIAWIDAERAARTARWEGRKNRSWRDWEVAALDEKWLFADESGVPPTKEMFNTEWRKVRDESGWNTHIPYRNMRHHACLWMFDLDEAMTWVEVARWTGHDHRTLEAFYVLPAEDSVQRWRAAFDEH